MKNSFYSGKRIRIINSKPFYSGWSYFSMALNRFFLLFLFLFLFVSSGVSAMDYQEHNVECPSGVEVCSCSFHAQNDTNLPISFNIYTHNEAGEIFDSKNYMMSDHSSTIDRAS